MNPAPPVTITCMSASLVGIRPHDAISAGTRASDEAGPGGHDHVVAHHRHRRQLTSLGHHAVVAQDRARPPAAPAPTRAPGRSTEPSTWAPRSTTAPGADDAGGHGGVGGDRAPAPSRLGGRTVPGRRARRGSTPRPPPDGRPERAARARVPSSRSALRLQVGGRRPGVEPVGVAGHGEHRALGGQGREGLALDRHPPAGGDARQDLGLEDVGPGVDQVGGHAGRAGGFSTNSRTRPSASVGTTPNRVGSSTALRWMVAAAPCGAVEGDAGRRCPRR